MFNQAAEALFRKDANGRLIFLPRGPRKTGYYIDAASDEQKIKALVKLQLVAVMFFNLTGFLGSYALAATWESLYFIHLHLSIEARVLCTGAVYLISAAVMQLTPMLVVQKVYQRSLRDICSTLQPAEPGSLGQLSRLSEPHLKRVLVVLAVTMMLTGLLLAAVARRQVRKRHPAPNAACPPGQPTQ